MWKRHASDPTRLGALLLAILVLNHLLAEHYLYSVQYCLSSLTAKNSRVSILKSLQLREKELMLKQNCDDMMGKVVSRLILEGV